MPSIKNQEIQESTHWNLLLYALAWNGSKMNGHLNDQGKNVGILAMEVYTPYTFVSQEKLESYYGVDAGKYTLGLGQDGLAVCGDCEDVNSLALTVVQSLLEKYASLPLHFKPYYNMKKL